MTVAELKTMAARRGINAGRMKKAELIRAIQQQEGNNPCFGTGKAGECGQAGCLWRDDCD